MNKIINKIELLAPSGDKNKAYYALSYGADAIYIGAKEFSLRKRAGNFDIPDIKEIVDYAHSLNKKVYLVMNVICRNFLFKDFDKFFNKIKDIKIDAYIVADVAIIHFLNKNYPDKEIHISTQQSTTNSASCLFWKKYANATRVVLGRELTLNEIKKTSENLNNEIELEIFIHGAVCISYSGRCMMSNNFSLRDANVGGCAQSCRWKYHIEDKDSNQQNKHFFTMSPKDMSYINYLKELMELNIASFKIEGRMKSVNYIAEVVKTYREIMDKHYQNIDFDTNVYFNKLKNIANRDIDSAFINNADESKMLYHDKQKLTNQDFIFSIEKIIDKSRYLIRTKNNFNIDQEIRLINPFLEDQFIKIDEIIDLNNNPIKIANIPDSELYITINSNCVINKYTLGKLN